jgi:hypothetical protein
MNTYNLLVEVINTMFASNQVHMIRSKYKGAVHEVALTVYCNDVFYITCLSQVVLCKLIKVVEMLKHLKECLVNKHMKLSFSYKNRISSIYAPRCYYPCRSRSQKIRSTTANVTSVLITHTVYSAAKEDKLSKS